jgi:hypothetical protein
MSPMSTRTGGANLEKPRMRNEGRPAIFQLVGAIADEATPPERNMFALAASSFPWPGDQNPQQVFLPEHPVRGLLLRANDLGFGATAR